MFDTTDKYREISKWILRIIICCILIYLGLRHIQQIAEAVVWLADLLKPILFGFILALIFNVPMKFWEDILQNKCHLKKGLRPLSIVLALVLVLGVFVGVFFLVVPELLDAIKLIIQIASGSLDQLAQWENSAALSDTPIGQYFSEINIDWIDLKIQLEKWFAQQSSLFMDCAVDMVSVLAGEIVTLCVSFVFSIYILANKKRLKYQICRLIRVWLPKRFGEVLIHVSVVCNHTFQRFIAGQATEAIILGTLCMIGMAILRLPYAPMIGALIGVTALIPIVGAFVGTIIGAIMIMTVNPFQALVFVVFLLILQQLEGNLIYPRVVGSKINLPAMWVLAAVTVGGNLAGPFGMLLGVPAASAAYALLKEATTLRENQASLSNESADKI